MNPMAAFKHELINKPSKQIRHYITYPHTHITVVGYKLSGYFKFFFDIINVRVTFLDAKGPIKLACDEIQGFFYIVYPYSAKNM